MIQTQALFFDGESSKPQSIAVYIDERFEEVVFSLSSIIYKWPVGEISLHIIAGAMEIHHGSEPVQVIKTDDASFISGLKLYMKERGHIGWYQKIIDLGIKAHIAIGLLILGFIIAGYLFVLPKVAEKAVFLIPESYDNEMGSGFYNQFVTFKTIDAEKTEALTLFANQLELANEKDLKFTVIKSDVVNAFALPDGNIIVFTGIIDLMEGYDELAGLLSHEVVHINERHSMKMLCRNLAGYLFLSVALSDVNGVVGIIGDNIHSLQSLSYSRQFEQEADIKGMEILIKNNIDPEGMTRLFQRLQKDYDKLIPEFISSHPVTENRIHYIEKRIKEKQYNEFENEGLKKLFLQVKGLGKHSWDK